MPIPFNPPEWLIREYMNRKSPAEEANAGIQSALNAYVTIDQAKRRNALAAQQIELEKAKIQMEQGREQRQGREMFYNYGDPTYLPQDIQSQMGPVQGPNNQMPVDYLAAQQQQLSGKEGPAVPMTEEVAPAQPQVSPIIDHFRKFKEANEFGLKGQQFTEDIVINKDNEGKEVSRSVVRRPVKGKTIMSGPGYQAQRMFTPQKTDLVDANGNLMSFIPDKGYVPAQGGQGLTPRKGDESAVGDVALMTQQMPNISKLVEGYKTKSMLGSERLGIAAQSTPAGYLMDPQLKQIENSLQLAAFTFGGKNLTGQEKEVVFGAMFPHAGDDALTLDKKGELLTNYFNGKIDLLQAANLLGGAGATMRQMLEQKKGSGGPARAQSAPAQGGGSSSMAHLSEEELQRIANGG